MKSEHAFDLDAEVEPIPDTTTATEAGASEAGDEVAGPGFMEEFDHMDDDMDNDAGYLSFFFTDQNLCRVKREISPQNLKD